MNDNLFDNKYSDISNLNKKFGDIPEIDPYVE